MSFSRKTTLLIDSTLINSGITRLLRIETGTKTVGMKLSLLSSVGSLDLSVFEDSTFTHAAGNVLTPKTQDRNFSFTSELIICHTPTGSGDGTLIHSELLGPSQLLDPSIDCELKAGTVYLIKMLSGAASNRVTLRLSFEE